MADLVQLLKEQCFADGAQTEQAAISCASVQSGILVSLSNGATFIGAPIMGLMSDTLGRRAFLMVSAAALSFDLISLSLAPTYVFPYLPLTLIECIQRRTPVLHSSALWLLQRRLCD